MWGSVLKLDFIRFICLFIWTALSYEHTFAVRDETAVINVTFWKGCSKNISEFSITVLAISNAHTTVNLSSLS